MSKRDHITAETLTLLRNAAERDLSGSRWTAPVETFKQLGATTLALLDERETMMRLLVVARDALRADGNIAARTVTDFLNERR